MCVILGKWMAILGHFKKDIQEDQQHRIERVIYITQDPEAYINHTTMQCLISYLCLYKVWTYQS
jgi:hypothetical protein